jgi:mannose-6-phosphate isomerase-like protein (cupin superfamily)
MADYTKVNLKEEVEDAAPKFGMAPAVEARFAHDALDATVTGISYQRLDPDARMPFGHSHERQEEIYVVLSGSGRVKLDDEVVELEPLDAVRIAAPTMRDVEAGPDGIEYLVFGAPRGEKNDAEMVQEWWAQTDG